MAPQVAVTMGSDSDLQALYPGLAILKKLMIPFETRILSAHRTPLTMMDFAQQAESNGFKVIIAGAGGSAHLPGMIASLTTLPVIGVPIKSKSLGGVDSMHSIIQMPGGVPVATVAIDGGLNAGLLAAQILAISDKRIEKEIKKYRANLHNEVRGKDKKLLDIGIDAYMESMINKQ